MRCPKCQYISFDDVDRCRNCGYDFSMLRGEAPLDLPIRSDSPEPPPGDLGLVSARRRSTAATATPPADREGARQLRRPFTPGGLDLPLFNDGRDDAPMVSAPAVPRQPLSVRRAAPVTPRPRYEPVASGEPALEFPESVEPVWQQPAQPAVRATGVVDTGTAAPAGRRLTAAAIDVLVNGAIDAGVLYATLSVCRLPLNEITGLPWVPMAAFLLILNGGYLTMFTAAGGQTIGKMIAGIRVVPAAPSDQPQRVPFGTAAVRAAASFASLLLIGVGFFMALFRADGRALHDAVADTRVIKA
jgi:uncharacterized RDD family membrane protein YckC